MTYKAPGIFANKADTNLALEPFFRIHDARYMMYWSATISGTVGVQARPRDPASPAMVRFKDGVNFSFSCADPSRRVLLYTLSGRKIADLPAGDRTAFLHFNRSVPCGMYAIRIASNGYRTVERIFISGN